MFFSGCRHMLRRFIFCPRKTAKSKGFSDYGQIEASVFLFGWDNTGYRYQAYDCGKHDLMEGKSMNLE